MRRTIVIALALFLCFGLGNQPLAGDINGAVLKLDRKQGKCPCFDRADLDKLIDEIYSFGGTPACTYTFNVDRRIRIFDKTDSTPGPNNQAFTRAGVACFGPKVKAGNAPGLPITIGSFAMYDSEGKNCRKRIIKAANKNYIECKCINQDGETVACPDFL